MSPDDIAKYLEEDDALEETHEAAATEVRECVLCFMFYALFFFFPAYQWCVNCTFIVLLLPPFS
jgi:hypothetical protein